MTVWYMTATNLANSFLGDGSVTAEHEKALDALHTPANDGTTIAATVLGGQSGWTEFVYTTNSAVTGSATWGTIANSTLTISYDISLFGSIGTIAHKANRMSADTTTVRSVGTMSSFAAATGVQTSINLEWNADSGSGNAATDVLAIEIMPTNSNMMTATSLFIYITDSDSYVDIPLALPSQTVSCNVINTSSTILSPDIVPVRDFNTDEWYFTDTNAFVTGTSTNIQKAMSVTATPSNTHSNIHTEPVASSTPENTHSYRTEGDGPGILNWPLSDWYIGLEIYSTGDFDTFDLVLRRLDIDNFTAFSTHTVVTDQTLSPGYNIFEFGPITWTTVNSHGARDTTDNINIIIQGVTQTTGTAQNFSVVWDSNNSYVGLVSSTPTIVCPVITTSSTLFNPTIINTQEINLNVLNATSTVLSPSITVAAQTVQANVINATSTLFSPDVIQNIALNVLNTTSTIFSPSIEYVVSLNVLNATSTVNAPSIVLRLFAPVINAPSTVYIPNIVAKLLMDILSTTSTVFSPSNLHRFSISMQSLSTTSIVNNPTVNSDIALNVVNTTSTIFGPSLVYDIQFQVINAPETVFSPATDTSVNVESLAITTTSTIFNPTLDSDIRLDVYNAPATVPNPSATSAGAEQDISLVVIDAASTVLNPDVTTLTTVEAQVLDSPSTVFSPSLKHDVVLPVVTTVSTIFSPSLEQIVEMQFINTAPVVYAPRIGEEVDDGFSGAIIKGPDNSPFPIGIR